MDFKIHSDYKPTGDQPKAIDALAEGIRSGMHHQTLLGVTGSGKTFTMANLIEKVQKPTLVIAHNKTLAYQLASEFREFFPERLSPKMPALTMKSTSFATPLRWLSSSGET